MTTESAAGAPARGRDGAPDLKLVVGASAAGTAFEWYDFLVFGSLAPVLAATFFSGVNETAGFIFALLTFAAGFVARPLGGLVFGRMGDRRGRKGAFLVTIVVMGAATVAIGLLPGYRQIGLAAPALLVALRIIQGFALGGEYGGAATYVAEHAPADRRGELTAWIQASAALGLIGAQIVILCARGAIGEAAFTDWGWRIPFLFSAVLLFLSVVFRMRLQESPVFDRQRASGEVSKAPWREAFGQWRNLRLVLIAFFGLMLAQGAVWYTGFFYAQFFLERMLRVPAAGVNLLLLLAAAASAVLYLVFGRLSDKVGRKPVLLFGMVLALVTLLPGFHLMTRVANPRLAQAAAESPVVILADPRACNPQFDPLGRTQARSACDEARRTLTRIGAPYEREARVGSDVTVKVGAQSIDFRAEDGAERLTAVLNSAGYLSSATLTPAAFGALLAIVLVFVTAATALYGPLAAALVELFPTRVRYTALSLPYHIGSGWIGGFMPATAFAMVAATGDIYFGLWYPLAFTAVSIVVAALFLPETKGRRLDEITTGAR